jgi:hypothetical protein
MMSKDLGVGAMISLLGGNEESVKAFQACIGKKIAALVLDPEANGGDGALRFTFDDGSKMLLLDDARSCCESRYMHTDDDLAPYIGSKLKGAEVAEGPAPIETSDYEVKETAFLKVKTTKGTFTVVSYNNHNGYYGGISIRAREDS